MRPSMDLYIFECLLKSCVVLTSIFFADACTHALAYLQTKAAARIDFFKTQ